LEQQPRQGEGRGKGGEQATKQMPELPIISDEHLEEITTTFFTRVTTEAVLIKSTLEAAESLYPL